MKNNLKQREMSEGQNKIQIFNNKQFGTIRTIEENGKVLFCATDVARALGYSNARDAINRHCKSEGVVKRDGVSQSTNQYGVTTEQVTKMKFINEGNVYRLITHSKLPAAEQFERWVFDEVLPTIRNTGGYVANEEQFVETYIPFADENTKALFRQTLNTIRQLNSRVEQQNEKIEQDKPLVDFANHVTNAENCIDVGALAKLAHDEHNINIGRNKLFKWLRGRRYIRASGEPYQKFINRGYFDVVETVYKTPQGIKTATKTVVTGKGQIYFINTLLKESCNATT